MLGVEKVSRERPYIRRTFECTAVTRRCCVLGVKLLYHQQYVSYEMYSSSTTTAILLLYSRSTPSGLWVIQTPSLADGCWLAIGLELAPKSVNNSSSTRPCLQKAVKTKLSPPRCTRLSPHVRSMGLTAAGNHHHLSAVRHVPKPSSEIIK